MDANKMRIWWKEFPEFPNIWISIRNINRILFRYLAMRLSLNGGKLDFLDNPGKAREKYR